MRFFTSVVFLRSSTLLINGFSQLPPLGGQAASKQSTAKTEQADEEDSSVSQVADDVPLTPIPQPQAASVSVPSQARDEFSRAKQAMIKKDWQQAESILLLMTNTYPKLAGVYTNLGIVYSEMGEPDKAINAYNFAIQTNPLNFDAYTNLGKTLRERGKFEEAEANYVAALKLWPHHQASLVNLGVLYDLYMGRLEEALQYYQLAQKLNEEEDRKLKGWIIDLQRRLPTQQSDS